MKYIYRNPTLISWLTIAFPDSWKVYFSVYIGTIAKEKHSHEAETKQSPPLARSNSGFTPSEGGSHSGFVTQEKANPTLRSVSRSVVNGSSGTQTLHKGNDETTETKETKESKKPDLPAIIYSVKGY